MESGIYKFRGLAVIAIVEYIIIWILLNNTITYNLSLLENIITGVIFVVFFGLLFFKRQVRTLVNKVLEW